MLDGWMVQDDSAGEEARMPGRARALVHVHMAREPLCVSRVGGVVFCVGLAERNCSGHPYGFPYGKGGTMGLVAPWNQHWPLAELFLHSFLKTGRQPNVGIL